MKEKPKKIWAAGFNFVTMFPPRIYTLNEDLDSWWDERSDMEVKKLGLGSECGLVFFSSESKTEVDLWWSGVSEVAKHLRSWVGSGRKK